MKKILFFMSLFMLSALSQAQRKVEIAEPVQQNLADANARVIKRKVAIGRFSNETQYAKGIFYDKENDPMGKQALDILSAKLAASGKFLLLERSDLASLLEEAKKGEGDLSTIGADYMIIGSVTEFGRKNVGKSGAFTSTKQQVVEAAVSVRLVEVATGLIIYSDEGKGMAELTTKTTMGVGGRADYDATLSDKAISEQVYRQAMAYLFPFLRQRCTTHSRWRKPGHQGGRYFCCKDQRKEG